MRKYKIAILVLTILLIPILVGDCLSCLFSSDGVCNSCLFVNNEKQRRAIQEERFLVGEIVVLIDDCDIYPIQLKDLFISETQTLINSKKSKKCSDKLAKSQRFRKLYGVRKSFFDPWNNPYQLSIRQHAMHNVDEYTIKVFTSSGGGFFRMSPIEFSITFEKQKPGREK